MNQSRESQPRGMLQSREKATWRALDFKEKTCMGNKRDQAGPGPCALLLKPHYSRCGPQSGSTEVTWELLEMQSWAPPHTYIRISILTRFLDYANGHQSLGSRAQKIYSQDKILWGITEEFQARQLLA